MINKNFLKIELFFLSLWLLFIFIFILSIDFSFINTNKISFKNYVSIFMFILFFACIPIYCHLKDIITNSFEPAHKITEIKDKSYDQLSFFTTNIIPLVCLDFDNKNNFILVAIILISLCAITLKMKLFLANPTLLLIGFKLFEIKVKEGGSTITVISRNELEIGQHVNWIRLDKNIWYAKKVN